MKLDINKVELKQSTDNIYQLLHNNATLKFWSPKILVPFGINNEYNKYVIKLELESNNPEHEHFKKILLSIEKIIKKKFNIEDIELKSVIKTRENKNELIECRIKTMKNNILTQIEYEDKDKNYLKTIFDMPKQCHIKAQIEVYGLWDYRTEKKELNKTGLIIYVSNILVLSF